MAKIRIVIAGVYVCLAVGVVSLGTALYFYLSHQQPVPSTVVKPAVAVVLGFAQVSVEIPF